MRALSIRQPFAELILRGIKTVEYRSRATRILGERFYIYASLQKWSGASGRWSVRSADNIVVPDAPLPNWMIEIAQQVQLIAPDVELPMGVIVGSAVISKCERIQEDASRPGPTRVSPGSTVQPPTSMYRWHLTGVERATQLRKPTAHPQPVWFNPF